MRTDARPPVGGGHGQDRGYLAIQFRMGELDSLFGLTGSRAQQPLSPEVGSELEHRDAVSTGHRLRHHDGALPFEPHHFDRHFAEGSCGGSDCLHLD